MRSTFPAPVNSVSRFVPGRSFVSALAFLLLAVAPSARAQKLTANAAPAAPVTVEERRKALNALFHDYWEDQLEHAPEFASTIGDKRWNDKISDYSVKAINEGLEREQNFLMKLAAIDPAGLSDDEKQDLLAYLKTL